MDLGIEGKTALVTGGSRGLGKHAALSLAREGVNVAICGRTQQTLDDTVKELEGLGVSSLGVVADVSDIGVVGSLHQQVVDGLGTIDILVNNVGGTRSRDDITGTSLDDFKGTFDLNLFGAFQLMKLAIPHMQAQRWGRIINIASIWGREHGGNISYMSAKAALIGASKSAANSLAVDGVLVNSIARAPSRTRAEAGSAFRTTTPRTWCGRSSNRTCRWAGLDGRSRWETSLRSSRRSGPASSRARAS